MTFFSIALVLLAKSQCDFTTGFWIIAEDKLYGNQKLLTPLVQQYHLH